MGPARHYSGLILVPLLGCYYLKLVPLIRDVVQLEEFSPHKGEVGSSILPVAKIWFEVVK